MLFQVYMNGNAFSVCYCAACLNAADFNFNLWDATLPSNRFPLAFLWYPVCFRPPFKVLLLPRKSLTRQF